MDPIDRYLRAVRSELPRDQRDDIVRELADNLRSEFEDREAELGRPMSDAEQDAILRGHGHPMTVAARYRGDERVLAFGATLVGPELFPVYLRVLSINVVLTVAIGIVLAVVFVGEGSLGSILYGLAVPIVIQFAIVTAIFVVADRRFVRAGATWDPRSVGPTRDEHELAGLDLVAFHFLGKGHHGYVPRTTSTLELALSSIVLVWWFAFRPPEVIGFLVPGPGWTSFFWPVAGVIVANMVQSAMTLVRPDLARFRYFARATVDTAAAVMLAASLGVGRWVELRDRVRASADEVNLVTAINGIVGASIVVTIVFTIVTILLEIRRVTGRDRGA